MPTEKSALKWQRKITKCHYNKELLQISIICDRRLHQLHLLTSEIIMMSSGDELILRQKYLIGIHIIIAKYIVYNK